jgi:hypothetical protein
MTDKSDGKPWARTNNLIVVLSECVILASMILRYLHPAVAAILLTLMLGGYLISVFGRGPRRSSTQPAPTTAQLGN